MSFPVGEQFFIDSVRNGFKALPRGAAGAVPRRGPGLRRPGGHASPPARAVQRAPGKAGPGQRLGSPRGRQRLKLLEGVDPRHWLAHHGGQRALHRDPGRLDAAQRRPAWQHDPRLTTLWLWHSAEESEHKSTAFDLYQALGGSHEWRMNWFRRVTTIFLGDTLRQTVNNLRRDGTLVEVEHLEERRQLSVRQARPGPPDL